MVSKSPDRFASGENADPKPKPRPPWLADSPAEQSLSSVSREQNRNRRTGPYPSQTRRRHARTFAPARSRPDPVQGRVGDSGEDNTALGRVQEGQHSHRLGNADLWLMYQRVGIGKGESDA
jgi:hypothetical protein